MTGAPSSPSAGVVSRAWLERASRGSCRRPPSCPPPSCQDRPRHPPSPSRRRACVHRLRDVYPSNTKGASSGLAARRDGQAGPGGRGTSSVQDADNGQMLIWASESRRLEEAGRQAGAKNAIGPRRLCMYVAEALFKPKKERQSRSAVKTARPSFRA